MNESLILYHGTDARLIAFSETERYTYLEDCKKVIQYLWSIFKPYYVTQQMVEATYNGNKIFVLKRSIETYKNYVIEQTDENLWLNFLQALSMCECNENGSQLYQYGYLYLTGDKEKAKRYAFRSFAGGELGLTAYRLIQGAEILKKDISYEELDAMDKIKDFAIEMAKPIILKINNLDKRFLYLENGKPLIFDEEFFRIGSYRYTQKIDLSRFEIEYL